MSSIHTQKHPCGHGAHPEKNSACSALAGLDAKCAMLAQSLEGQDRIAVAYSGGVDSTFIAWFTHTKLKKSVQCFFADTPFISREERAGALRTAEELGLALEIITFDPLDSLEVRANPVDRCYFCKREVFGRIIALAAERNCQVVVDGSHAGDQSGYRPGKRALSELGVLSPLAFAGLVKEEIRRLSLEAGISNWDKPSQSCLATRVPYGTPLSIPLLQKIEEAEECLHALGCIQVRVRCHDDLARIELPRADFARILALEASTAIVEQFRRLGFAHVTLDLAGFRSGSWDEKTTRGSEA